MTNRLRHALDSYARDVSRLSAAESTTEGTYYPAIKSQRRWKLLPYDVHGGYEEWPSVNELFVLSSPGVNPNRGIEGSVIDVERARLEDRMRAYFSDASHDQLSRTHPVLMAARARYQPDRVRDLLRGRGFQPKDVQAYLLFPLDARFIYYETHHKLLNEAREHLRDLLDQNEFLVLVNESRRASETKPLISCTAFDLHLFDVGAPGFPAERRERVETALDVAEPHYIRLANLAPSVWAGISKRWDLAGSLQDKDAKILIRNMFRVALAIGHSPAFQRDFSGSLAHDWLHVPIPRSCRGFLEIAQLGDKLAVLLDPSADQRRLHEVMSSLLGNDVARLAVVSTDDGGPADENDFRVDIAHFGAAPGGWRPRLPQAAEPWHNEWGESTGDLAISGRVFLRHVPERACGTSLEATRSSRNGLVTVKPGAARVGHYHGRKKITCD